MPRLNSASSRPSLHRHELPQSHGVGVVIASDPERRESTVAVPSSALARYGVSRDVKSSALRQLEADGLVTVKRFTCKNPIVTVMSRIADRTVGD